jgi:hypothetical protein
MSSPASICLIGACGAVGTRSSGATITRLDGSTIDTIALTPWIEAHTRAANVHGLTVTIFNGRGEFTRVRLPGRPS